MTCFFFNTSFGEKLAFLSPTDTGWQLFITEPEGINTMQLTFGEYDVREPDWFADRRKIVFTTTAGDAFIIEVQSSKIIDTLTSDKYFFWQASVNSNGSLLFLIAGKPEEADQTFILKYSISDKTFSSELQLRTPVYHIDVSPLNNNLIFANTLCGSACGHIIQEIWFKHGEGNNAWQIHLFNRMSRYPRWHPTGKEIVFDSEWGEGFTLFRQHLDSAKPEIIISPSSPDDTYTQPAISPDGRHLLYLKNEQMYICLLANPEKSKKVQPFPDKPYARIKDPAW